MRLEQKQGGVKNISKETKAHLQAPRIFLFTTERETARTGDGESKVTAETRDGDNKTATTGNSTLL